MNNTFNFEGKVAFVTGGGSGIGRAAALAFARAGASVAVADIGEQANQETARLIEQEGGRAVALRCDVTKAAEVKAAVEKAAEKFGRLDFAFNNAGLEPKKPAPTADYDEEEWNRIIDIDLRGVFLCMKHEIPHMLAQGGGAIVNTASVAGLIGLPSATNYVAAKHGVVGITKTAAMEYAQDNIRVNCVNPGYIKTPMTDPSMAERYDALMAKVPMHRLGQPEEIAEAVVWMLSDRASFMTGVSHIIDGGYTAA